MAFADDLLEQARHLATRERSKPRQASLRRAISTAYYALFHLLISESTRNWKHRDQRPVLARLFDHGRMKTASENQRDACNKFLKLTLPARAAHNLKHLRHVADTFVFAHQQRSTADYDNAKQWTRTQARNMIERVEDAFESWHMIRKEPAAQAYLLSLLGNPKRM